MGRIATGIHSNISEKRFTQRRKGAKEGAWFANCVTASCSILNITRNINSFFSHVLCAFAPLREPLLLGFPRDSCASAFGSIA